MDVDGIEAVARHGVGLVRVGLAWWRSELAMLVPARWRRRWMPFSQLPLYVWRDATLVPAQPEQASPRNVPLAIAVDPALAQRVQLTLPAAVEPRLRQAVALQLARHTPFLPDQVMFDCRVEARNIQARVLAVQLAIVPKRVIAEALAAAQGLGRSVTSLGLLPAAGATLVEFDFLHQRVAVAGFGAVWRRLLLIGLPLLSLLVGSAFWQAQQAFQELQASVDKMALAAQDAEKLQAEIDRREAWRWRVDEMRAESGNLKWLAALTQVLPDDVWLTAVKKEAAEIRITGTASDASSLIGQLDASIQFERSRFNAPIRQEVDRQQFDLSFAIAPSRAERAGP